MGDENQGTSKLSPEMQEEINKSIGATVANMITARLSTFEKKFQDKLQGALTESLGKTLDERFASFKPAPTEETPEPGGKKNKGENTELATLKSQMAALVAKNEAAERRASDLWQRQRESALRDQTARFLQNAGIVGDRFEGAYALLVQKGLVKLSEDAESTEGLFADPSTGGDVSLEVGLANWLKGDSAKIYMPPSGVRGSGSRPAPGGPNGNQKPTPDQIRAAVATRLTEELGR